MVSSCVNIQKSKFISRYFSLLMLKCFRSDAFVFLHVRLRVSVLNSQKILIGLVLNVYIDFREEILFNIVSLPMSKNVYLFRSSSMSYVRVILLYIDLLYSWFN